MLDNDTPAIEILVLPCQNMIVYQTEEDLLFIRRFLTFDFEYESYLHTFIEKEFSRLTDYEVDLDNMSITSLVHDYLIDTELKDCTLFFDDSFIKRKLNESVYFAELEVEDIFRSESDYRTIDLY